MVKNSGMGATNPRRRKRRSMGAQQWAAVIGGGALAVYGIARRSPLGAALAASGGSLAAFGVLYKPKAQSDSARTSVLINCKPEEAYGFWKDIENLPRFMNRLQSVTKLDEQRSRWIAIGPMGRPIRWDAQIIDDRENESISWRSLPGSEVQVDGRVEFREAPAGRGTIVSAEIQYSPAPGLSSSFAKLLRKGANFAMRQDMRRLEALMEAGEIPTTEGQPHGPRDRVTGVMRMMDPTRPIAPGSSLKDTFAARRSIA